MGRVSSCRVVAETVEMRRRVQTLQEQAGNRTRKNFSRKRRKVLDNTGSLLSDQSLAVWPSFLEEMCGGDGVVMEW